jgi:hypothetical protein
MTCKVQQGAIWVIGPDESGVSFPTCYVTSIAVCLFLCWHESYATICVIIEINGIVYNFKCKMTDIKTKWCLLDTTVCHSQTYVKYNTKSYVIKEIKRIVRNFKCDVTDLKKGLVLTWYINRSLTNVRKIKHEDLCNKIGKLILKVIGQPLEREECSL